MRRGSPFGWESREVTSRDFSNISEFVTDLEIERGEESRGTVVPYPR